MAWLKKIYHFLSTLFIAGFFLAVFISVGLIISIFRSSDVSGVSKAKTDRAVGVVELEGPIMSSSSFRKSFKKMHDNEKIKALVVRIDSPGGAVGASEEVFRIIKNSKKPTVCSLGNVAASGGLYSAVACNKIVANLGTITGSIGVILTIPNVSTVVDKVGVKMNVVKSGKFKDLGSPFKTFTEDDQSFLQGVVNQSYEQFVGAISEQRKLARDEVKKFADGRIILGEKALELGLIDEIGGIDLAGRIALVLARPDEKGEPELIFSTKMESLSDLFEHLSEKIPLQWIFQKQELRLLFL